MIKKKNLVIIIFLVLNMLILSTAENLFKDNLKEKDLYLEIHPLESMDLPEGNNYISLTPDTITVSSYGRIKAIREGEGLVTMMKDGQELNIYIKISDEIPTELIKKTISIALEEWEVDGEKRLKKSNKYTRWYCKKPCEFGWCGGFIGWALDEAGVPMTRWMHAEPVGEHETHGIAEAGVGKILTGYTKMERLTRLPRPGYIIVYGVRKSGNKTVHVGLITDVEYVGGDTYIIGTVEGNIGSKIKRYKYYYDASEEARENEKNIFPLEEELQYEEKINYKYAVDTWYINIIAQTYK